MKNEITIEELKPLLKNYVETNLTPSKGKDKYVCPLCGSGEGKNGTGAFSLKPDSHSWKCFSCSKGGDILDLIGELYQISDTSARKARVCEELGIDYDRDKLHARIKREVAPTPAKPTEQQDQTSFFLQAHENIGNTDYWAKRGLSRAIVDRFQLGYVDAWRHPKVHNASTSPRLIIPTGKASYLARDTRADIPKSAEPFSKQKVGSMEFFNIQALQGDAESVFIVEGEIDALSVIEAGGEAIALGSVSMVKKFVAKVEQLLNDGEHLPTFLLALDSDDKGQEASNELEGALNGLGLPCAKVDINNGCKDPNDAITRDRAAFMASVARVQGEHAERLSTEAAEAKAQYLATSSAGFLESFMMEIQNNKNETFIPTEFFYLDNALDGGLYSGLYIIGAISSLGKTTFMLQVADQAAAQGQDVLIFSLEMSRFEVMAKSISRHTVEKARALKSTAKTTRGIWSGRLYSTYGMLEKNAISLSLRDYAEYSKHVYIHEGMGNIGAEQVREAVKQHIHFTGKKPLVIIDYLQLLAPADPRASDKQNTDKAVLELKRISRDFNIAVIGISSFNRANYSTKVSFESFKESGAIEYSSDVLMGLQLAGAGSKDFDVTKAKSQNPREVELVILKNRNGAVPNDAIKFKFYPQFNLFDEVPS